MVTGNSYLQTRKHEIDNHGRRCEIVSDGDTTIALVVEAQSRIGRRFKSLEDEIVRLERELAEANREIQRLTLRSIHEQRTEKDQ